jgi:hypothetical protein
VAMDTDKTHPPDRSALLLFPVSDGDVAYCSVRVDLVSIHHPHRTSRAVTEVSEAQLDRLSLPDARP